MWDSCPSVSMGTLCTSKPAVLQCSICVRPNISCHRESVSPFLYWTQCECYINSWYVVWMIMARKVQACSKLIYTCSCTDTHSRAPYKTGCRRSSSFYLSGAFLSHLFGGNRCLILRTFWGAEPPTNNHVGEHQSRLWQLTRKTLSQTPSAKDDLQNRESIHPCLLQLVNAAASHYSGEEAV